VIAVEDEMLKKAFRSNLKDVEDAIQLECAYVVKNISGLVTRNIKDFKSAKIPVIGPEFITNL
jgi:ribosomal protein S17E